MSISVCVHFFWLPINTHQFYSRLKIKMIPVEDEIFPFPSGLIKLLFNKQCQYLQWKQNNEASSSLYEANYTSVKNKKKQTNLLKLSRREIISSFVLSDLRANNTVGLRMKQNLFVDVSCSAAAASLCHDTDLEIKHKCVRVWVWACVLLLCTKSSSPVHLFFYSPIQQPAAGLCILCWSVCLQHSMLRGVVMTPWL